MTIEELEGSQWKLITLDYDDNIRFKHLELSIQFAIEVLEGIGQVHDETILSQRLRNKIQELKQYLDGTE